MPTPLTADLSKTGFAFRGYNVTNLGRTRELLAIEAYRGILREELARYSAIAAEFTSKGVDLEQRVESTTETALEHYEESIALVAAVEVAHLRLLREVHQIEPAQSQLYFGYSLGELVALCVAGVFDLTDIIRIPLAMARDSKSLAADVTLGVLFSRGPAFSLNHVQQLCRQVTCEGRGTIDVSSMLSPNTYLLLGQRETIARFKTIMPDLLPSEVHLRITDQRWPPLHTSITWQRQIPDRAGILLETVPGGFSAPVPNVLSLVSGKPNYAPHNAREILRNWADHPQRLWDAVDTCLSAGIETVVHVGSEPNLIPATFHRLSENVQAQTTGNGFENLTMRAISGLAKRTWLAGLLPARANLLRAPFVRHVCLEDWLLENAPR